MTTLIKVETMVEDLLQSRVEVMDLPPIIDLLESIDNLLIQEFDKGMNLISLNKVRSIRKKLLERIEYLIFTVNK